MLEAVPARIVGRVAQAEVGAQVDDRRAGGDQLGHEARRRAVGQGHEHGIGVGERGIDDQAGRGQVRVDAADRVAVAIATHEPDERRRSGGRRAAGQLRADIPGGADDRDPDLPRTSVGIDAALGTRHEPFGRLAG